METSFKDEINNNKKMKILAQVCLMVVLALLGIVFFYFGFAKRDVTSITFQEKGNADYQVYLKENDYYQSPYLEKGMSYVASLIDYVHIDFNYNLNSSRESQLKYKYKVTGELVITERGNEDAVLYRSKEDLTNEVTNAVKTNALINEGINIKYDEYNAKVNSFKQTYALSISSKLIVTMHVESQGDATDISQAEYSSANDIVVTIPLSEQTLEITFNDNVVNESKQIVEYSKFNPINYVYLGIGIITAIIVLVLLVKLVIYFYRKSAGESEYTKLKNTILKEYDRLIVETKEIKDQKKYRSEIIVNSFDELLDARDNLETPILFYEDVVQRISTFMVLDGSHVYIYRISEKKNQ